MAKHAMHGQITQTVYRGVRGAEAIEKRDVGREEGLKAHLITIAFVNDDPASGENSVPSPKPLL